MIDGVPTVCMWLSWPPSAAYCSAGVQELQLHAAEVDCLARYSTSNRSMSI